MDTQMARIARLLLALVFAVSAGQLRAAEFQYEELELSYLQRPIPGLVLRGKIDEGDAAKLQRLIAQDPKRFALYGSWLLLDSPGGDFDEALKIATLLRTYPTWVVVERRCVSACFLLYVAGASRMTGMVGNVLGVHSPYYEREQFARLSAPDAERAHRSLLERTTAYLRLNTVPEPIIEKMVRTSSATVAWLTDDEVRSSGDKPLWFRELALARCNLADRVKPGMSQHEVIQFAELFGECVGKTIREERERALFKR
jgi:hypothetical protein